MGSFIWLIPAFPLLGAIVNGLIGRRLPRAVSQWLAVLAMVGAFAVSLYAFFSLVTLPTEARELHQTLYSWIAVGKFQVDVAFLLDPLSAIMILIVTGVGLLIHIYSIGYMDHERNSVRFFTALNMFAFAMLMLVLADNYLVMFFGWEGVGLCSYLLIGYWFDREGTDSGGEIQSSPRSAATKAFVVNRVGDFGFTLGIILMFWTFGSVSFGEVFTRAPLMFSVGAPVITIMTLLLFMGATGKSAQIPLYVWLPDAMAGPTPVSALIHAATMVTAGVYMVARSHVLFSLSPTTLAVVALVGIATAFFAATVAIVQNDLKRVLAYSTVSQLGYMMVAMGLGAYTAGIFHLMTHAFFKALLFLGAGVVMHAMKDVIDMRKLGGLRKFMPITFWTFLIGALALSGFPFLSGFFSKDEILEDAFATGDYALWIVGIVTAVLTAFYIIRAVILTFGGKPRWEEEKASNGHGAHDDHGESGFHPHDGGAVMSIPLILLAGLAIFAGYLGLPKVLGENRFEEFLDPVFHQVTLPVDPALEWLLIGISTVAAFVGIYVAYRAYVADRGLPGRLVSYYPGVYRLLVGKYFVDPLYDATIARPGRWLANAFWTDVDGRIINGFVDWIGNSLRRLGGGLRRLESGYARAYALAMLIGIVVIIAVVVMR